jgi:hypothetical protein
MRRAILFSAILTVSASGLSAQWTGGFKTGLGQGAFTGSSAFAWSPTAMSVAAFLSRPITERVSAQLELLATQKNGESQVGGSILTFTGGYVSMPLLATMSFQSRGTVTPFALGGASVTVESNCHLQLIVSGLVSNIECAKPGLMNRVNVGVVGGGGLRRAIGAAVLSVEARAQMDFRSVALPDGSGFGRSTGWSVLAGVSAPLRRHLFRRTPRMAVAGLPGSIRIDVLPSRDSGDAPRISMQAVDADVRTLILALARQAGVSLVVSEDVKAKLSMTIARASAADALHSVIAESGLSIAEQPREATYPALVYSSLPPRPR